VDYVPIDVSYDGVGGVYATAVQLEDSETVTAYQKTDDTISSSDQGFGMWTIAGGFGGTMQNPVIALNDFGLSFNSSSTPSTALTDNDILMGNITGTANSAIKVTQTGTNTDSGIFGYTSTGSESFALRLDGTSSIAGFDFTDTQFSATDFTLDTADKRITLGSANDIIVLDADEGLWAGDATLAGAPFSVTTGGAIKAESGTIGGFSITATTLSATDFVLDTTDKSLSLGSGNAIVVADADEGLWAGDSTFVGAPFSVTTSGELTATNATITGNITANTGSIAGFTIAANTLSATDFTLDTTEKRLSLGASSSIVIIDADEGLWAGDSTLAGAPFSVTTAGALTATNATITGDITANTGSIAGFTIAANTLSATDFELDTTNKRLTLGSASAIIIADADEGLWAGDATLAGAPFSVTTAGTLVATDATITGDITATTGSIAGFTLDGDSMTATDFILNTTDKRLTLGSLNAVAVIDADEGLWLGDATLAGAPFSVTTAGALTATDATIAGDITADSGSIAGFTINASTLTATDFELDTSNKRLTLGSGDIVAVMDADEGLWLGDANLVDAPFSVTTLGALTADDATITGELNISSPSIFSAGITVNGDITLSSGSLIAGTTTLDSTGITANQGSIAGFTIASNSLSATNFSLDTTDNRLTLGSSNAIIILDADEGI